MKTLITGMLIAMLAVTAAPAQHEGHEGAPAKVAGAWQMALETPHGSLPSTLDIKQEGSKLTGTLVSEHMGGTLAINGKVDGNKVTFSMEMHDGRAFTFNGTVEGKKMTGTTDPSGGTWTATRQ